MYFLYEEIPGGVRILRGFAGDGEVAVPDAVEGKPVLELGPYAFSDRMDERELKGENFCDEEGRMVQSAVRTLETQEDSAAAFPGPSVSGVQLREISLPSGIRRIGRYAFYNCRELRRFTFFGELSDLGAGAFTGCHRMEALAVEVRPDGNSCLRELLAELPEEIRVDLIRGGEHGRFWFPEFFEEGVENTPARILENHVHGSGIRYRNCFLHQALNIREYDEMFPHAKAWEHQELVTAMALGRLLYPMELSDCARERYEEYLRENLCTAADTLGKQRDYQSLGKLLRSLKPERRQTEDLLADAQRRGDTEAVSLFMDYLHSHTKVKRKVFDL